LEIDSEGTHAESDGTGNLVGNSKSSIDGRIKVVGEVLNLSFLEIHQIRAHHTILAIATYNL